jgi:DNA polymerase I-like protein with 3'-5' exonuclease and polymerase domains
MTFEEMKDLPQSKQKEIYEKIYGIRKQFKVVNYSSVYGVGAPKLARELKVKKARAKMMLDAYWQKNWGIKKFASEATVKIFDGKMWVKNPVSGFWHPLRFEKDIFSTLNQSTGVYCFDTWVAYCRASGLKMTAQFHDEIVVFGAEEEVEPKLKEAIRRANKKLSLNVTLDIDSKHGSCYSSVH